MGKERIKLATWLEMEKHEGMFAFLLVLPTLLIVFGLYIYPLAYSLALSFTDTDLKKVGVNFIGLKNYVDIFREPELVASFWKTIYFTVLSVAFEMVIGVLVAVAFNNKFRGRPVARSIILIPWAIPPVVNGIIWNWLVHSKIGVLNYLLTSFGLIESYKPWLADAGWALNIIICADVWKWTPLVVLLVLAGLQAIPETLYEAARVDGMGPVGIFFSITLPLLAWPMLITLLLRTVEAVRVFDIIYIMTRGGPANATKLTTYYVYEYAFKYHKLGFASALAYVVTVLIIVFLFIYFKSINRKVEY
jgi:multiple sugar transport system permease protein